MLPASLPSSCVALDQVPGLAEPQFLLQHRLAVHGETRRGGGGGGRGEGLSGLQPWGQHPISTERESLFIQWEMERADGGVSGWPATPSWGQTGCLPTCFAVTHLRVLQRDSRMPRRGSCSPRRPSKIWPHCSHPPMQKTASPTAPTAGERDQLKEWGCLSHFSVTPDVM